MSARTLPAHPSLQHLKSEAKQLHKALAAGDDDAADRARANLRRLSADSPVDDVSLQEVQHVLGREYGFHDWEGLTAAAEFTFDDLLSMSDEDLHRLLREVDQKDLVVSLKLASEAVKDRVLSGTSARVRQFIIEEMEFLGPMPEDEIRTIQGLIEQQVRLCAAAGDIAWPPGSTTSTPTPIDEPALEPSIEQAVDSRLTTLSTADIGALIQALSARQQAHGILSLEAAADVAVDGFVREALRLAVDGTEPALLEDILLTRTRALLQSLDNRLKMTIEGLASIHAGDNPSIVAHKMTAIYSTDFDTQIQPAAGTVESMSERLRQTQLSAATHDEFTAIIGGLAQIARRQGSAALGQLVADVDDEFLRHGLTLLADNADWDTLIRELEARMPTVLASAGQSYRMFTAGVAGIQQGVIGVHLDAAMDIGSKGGADL